MNLTLERLPRQHRLSSANRMLVMEYSMTHTNMIECLINTVKRQQESIPKGNWKITQPKHEGNNI